MTARLTHNLTRIGQQYSRIVALAFGVSGMILALTMAIPVPAQDGGQTPPPANVSAAQAEAREIARNQGNCTPGKIEVLRYALGRVNETVFKLECTERKETFVLVQCRSRICTLLR